MDPPGPPHEALFLSLAYLPLHSLLSMSLVCKSFRDALSNDVLLWLDLVVQMPLNLRLSDDILLTITAKSQGRLRTLALLNCSKITDDVLLRVVTANPLLTKLYVPGCTSLTPEGILAAVETLTRHSNRLQRVKINGIYNFQQEDLQVLQRHVPGTAQRTPRFYHMYRNSNFRSLDEDGFTIDIETCPKCEEVMLIFNCPRQTCQAKKGVTKCLGCMYCIPRCEGCGRCIMSDEDEALGDTICNDTLCLECWLSFPKCNHCNKPLCPRHADERVTPGSGGFICEICLDKILGNT